jgi:hypothetical protein
MAKEKKTKILKTLEYAPPHLSEIKFICGIDEVG